MNNTVDAYFFDTFSQSVTAVGMHESGDQKKILWWVSLIVTDTANCARHEAVLPESVSIPAYPFTRQALTLKHAPPVLLAAHTAVLPPLLNTAGGLKC